MKYLDIKLVKKQYISEDDLNRLRLFGINFKSNSKSTGLTSTQKIKIPDFIASDSCDDIKNPRELLGKIGNISKSSLETIMPSLDAKALNKELDDIDDVQVALRYIALSQEAKKTSAPLSDVYKTFLGLCNDVKTQAKTQTPLIASDLLDNAINGLKTTSSRLEEIKKSIKPQPN